MNLYSLFFQLPIPLPNIILSFLRPWIITAHFVSSSPLTFFVFMPHLVCIEETSSILLLSYFPASTAACCRLICNQLLCRSHLLEPGWSLLLNTPWIPLQQPLISARKQFSFPPTITSKCVSCWFLLVTLIQKHQLITSREGIFHILLLLMTHCLYFLFPSLYHLLLLSNWGICCGASLLWPSADPKEHCQLFFIYCLPHFPARGLAASLRICCQLLKVKLRPGTWRKACKKQGCSPETSHKRPSKMSDLEHTGYFTHVQSNASYSVLVLCV